MSSARLEAGGDSGPGLDGAQTRAGRVVGFGLEATPGAAVVLKRNGLRVEPFVVRARLAAGAAAAEDWQRLCAETGIGETDLGS